MGLLSFLGIRTTPAVNFSFDPGMSVQECSKMMADKLNGSEDADRAVFQILTWANEAKAKGESTMTLTAFGFNVYKASLTPTQEKILDHLKTLNLVATVVDHDKVMFRRTPDYNARFLRVSW